MDSSATTPSLPPTAARAPKPRWWPAVGILALAVVAALWIWFAEDTYRQRRILQTLGVVSIAVLLLLLWCVLWSRLRWWNRLAVLGVFVGLIGLAAFTLRIRGVTGDVLPVFEWRWAKLLEVAAIPAAAPPLTGAQARVSGQTPPGGWPQFLGPNRNNIPPGPRLARDWSAHPPQLIWRQAIAAAWSGFAVADGFAVTQEQRGPDELVTCYDALTGQLLWTHADRARYATTIAGEGPRATPTIDRGCVLTLGATGILNCLDLRSGERLWGHDLVKEQGGEVPVWGLSVSPLVLGESVVVAAGGPAGKALVAFEKATGRLAWSGGSDRVGYSSPVVCDLGGERQILLFSDSQVGGYQASSGQPLWKSKWPTGHPHVAMPLCQVDDRVVIGSGYGTGCESLQIRRGTNGAWTASRVWKSNRMKPKFANLVQRDGFLYGLDDGILACLDGATGDLKWKEGRYGHGQTILVGDLLLISAENGEVVLVEAAPLAHRELTRFAALKSKTWNPPALAGEFLFIRNDLEAACYRLPVAN